MTGIAYPSLCMACGVGEHRGPGEGGVCECACHRPVRAAGIAPAALTSDETVTAAFEAFNGATAVPFEAMRAALRAASLAAQGTGGDTGEHVVRDERSCPDCGESMNNEWHRDYRSGERCGPAEEQRFDLPAPASSSTQEGRRDG